MLPVPLVVHCYLTESLVPVITQIFLVHSLQTFRVGTNNSLSCPILMNGPPRFLYAGIVARTPSQIHFKLVLAAVDRLIKTYVLELPVASAKNNFYDLDSWTSIMTW